MQLQLARMMADKNNNENKNQEVHQASTVESVPKKQDIIYAS